MTLLIVGNLLFILSLFDIWEGGIDAVQLALKPSYFGVNDLFYRIYPLIVVITSIITLYFILTKTKSIRKLRLSFVFNFVSFILIFVYVLVQVYFLRCFGILANPCAGESSPTIGPPLAIIGLFLITLSHYRFYKKAK